MKSNLWTTVFFLMRFFAVYLALSWVYGRYIAHYDTLDPPRTDPFTREVVYEVTRLASWLGYETDVKLDDHLIYPAAEEQTYDSIHLNGLIGVGVEEGCNGLSIMILFVAFVLSFGGNAQQAAWFVPAGLVFIHLANLGRILFLAILNVDFGGKHFHFFHKYGFTAVIYAAVFALWFVWVQGILNRRKSAGV